jgi:hypothetical protein
VTFLTRFHQPIQAFAQADNYTIPTPMHPKLIIHLVDVKFQNDLQKHMFYDKRLNKEM